MVRPCKSRLVRGTPPVEYFKPRGVPMKSLQEVSLTLEGFEALRLVDTEGHNQQEASRQMASPAIPSAGC